MQITSIIRILVASALAIVAALAAPGTAWASGRYADSGGVRIAYEVVGKGEPLVLIPGFSQSRHAWKDAGFVEAFARRGRQLILIDPRGHGDSGKPHRPIAYAPERLAADIVAVLDDLGIGRADLLGYSRGGAIAIATAIHHRDRVRSIIAGGAHPYAEDMSFYRDAVAPGIAHWVALIERNAGPLPDNARTMFLANDVNALRAAAAADRLDLSAELAATGVPALFYAGSDDPRFGLARRFAEGTGARFLPLQGMNHFEAFFAVGPVVEAVEEFRRSASAGR